MSGYLKRVAASVQTPERRIHPIVGSLYSAPEFASPDTFQAEEVLLVSGAPRPVPQAAPEATNALEPRTTPTPEPAKRDAQRDTPSEETPARPLLAPHRRSEGDEPAIAYLRAQSPHTPASQPVVTLAGRPQNSTPEAEPVLSPTYRPLLDEARPLSVSPPESRHTSALTAPPRETRPAIAGRGYSPAPRPHDEIEIHIGRIEVTAVQQTAPRSAAPPARKSLNLEEYLKRGNRR